MRVLQWQLPYKNKTGRIPDHANLGTTRLHDPVNYFPNIIELEQQAFRQALPALAVI